MANLASLTSFKEGDRRKVIHSGSRMAYWKALFLGNFNSMFVLNLVGLLGLMPVILAVYNYYNSIWSAAALLPFGSSLGTGIFTVVDTASIQHMTTQALFAQNLLIYVPLAIIVSSVLISPFMYAMRNAEYDGKITGYAKAMVGFKYCGVKFGILGLISALLFECVVLAKFFYNEYVFANGSSFTSTLMLVAIILVAMVFAIVMIYSFIITVTYKMSIAGAMKRAISFTFTLPLQNVCVFAATMIPLLFTLVSTFFVSLVITLYIFVGLSYMMSIWMVYVQTVLSAATPQSAKKVKQQ